MDADTRRQSFNSTTEMSGSAAGMLVRTPAMLLSSLLLPQCPSVQSYKCTKWRPNDQLQMHHMELQSPSFLNWRRQGPQLGEELQQGLPCRSVTVSFPTC